MAADRVQYVSGYILTLDIDAPHAAGDLTVTGFCTARTATEIGTVLADALRTHFPDATVRGTVEKTRRDAP